MNEGGLTRSMLMMNDPQDILGIGIKNILEYRASKGELEPLVAGWKKIIVVEIQGIYAITIRFQDSNIQVEPSLPSTYDLKLTMSLNIMIKIAKGETGLIGAFLKGQVKVKKLWHVSTLLKFIKIIIPALKIAGERGRHFAAQH